MPDLDTRSKRASSVQALMPFMIAPPLPDGTISQGDRQHIAWTYSGILASGVTQYPRIMRVGFRSRLVKVNTKPILGE